MQNRIRKEIETSQWAEKDSALTNMQLFSVSFTKLVHCMYNFF